MPCSSQPAIVAITKTEDKADALIQDDPWTQVPPSIQSDKWIH